jgi:hypothetical protein
VTTGAWLYPHDLHDVPGLAALVRDAGLDTVCLASSYHSLLAASPANTTRRVVALPSSGVYFRPDAATWAGSALQPQVAATVAEQGDALEHGRRFADTAGASLTAWLVCLHEDGARDRPDLAVQSVTGDRLPGSLCLRAPEVREYALRLVRDAAARADAVQLESLHWLAQPHAQHAKVDGAAPRLSRLALSVCFCRRCREHAGRHGVDAGMVASELVTRWQAAWDGLEPDEPADVPGLAEYLDLRADAVTSLLADVVAAVDVPVEMVCFGDATLHGVRSGDLVATGADVRVLAYGSAEQLRSILTAYEGGGRHVGLSVLPEHVADLEAAEAAVRAARDTGAESMRLYHLGLAGERRRGWTAQLVDVWRGAR